MRTDTSVTGQVLKTVAAQPDGVLIAASGTPAVLPQRTPHERSDEGKYSLQPLKPTVQLHSAETDNSAPRLLG